MTVPRLAAGAAVGSQQTGVGGGLGLQPLLVDLLQQLLCTGHLPHVAERLDQRVVGEGVGGEASPGHILKRLHHEAGGTPVCVCVVCVVRCASACIVCVGVMSGLGSFGDTWTTARPEPKPKGHVTPQEKIHKEFIPVRAKEFNN